MKKTQNKSLFDKMYQSAMPKEQLEHIMAGEDTASGTIEKHGKTYVGQSADRSVTGDGTMQYLGSFTVFGSEVDTTTPIYLQHH